MAITKERLEELIRQEATIYYNNTLDVEKKILTPSKYKCDCAYLWELSHSKYMGGYNLEDLYETQEEAEWHLKQAEWSLKYQHIPRTEELNLPYWADIVEHKDDDIYKIVSFRRKNEMFYKLLFRRGNLMLWSVQELMNVWIDLATEENYTKLCDLCVKLFKGEEK